MDEDFLINIVYKNRKVKFKVTDPTLPLSKLMNNLRHATDLEGKLVFDFPSVDATGAPLDFYFGKEDTDTKELRILRPRIGKDEQTLFDYGVTNGDTIYLVADPFPG